MKTKSKANRELAKVFITIVMTIALCVFVWVFLNDQADQLTQGYMNGITKDNEYIVKTISGTISSSAEDEEQVVEILKSAPVTGSRYWLLLSSEKLIYERNAETTTDLAGMNYTELADSYIRNGGSGGSAFFEQIKAGKAFSAYVVKDRKLGSELISVVFIEVAGQKYCVGTSIQQNYMYSAGNIGERIFYLRIMTLIMCLILIALTTYFSYAIQKKSLLISRLRTDLTEKNMLVQEQGERLFESDSDESDKSDDNLTGLYNRRFFEAVIAKLATRDAENIGIIYVRISNLIALNYENGFASANRLIVETAKRIQTNATNKDICARIGRNEFAIIQFDTTYKSTLHMEKKLLGELTDLHPAAKFAVGSSFKWKDTTIHSAVEAASLALNKAEEGK